ncbi:hypothetical protein Hbl1158_12155 [Halobaculum sp. CBA1158]|uniref:hypothetical protein n=1 Tax=Halobaculum sp. CBA1158 TaxID=2904243 RepID=UPI001F1F7EAD|nr:hypothetical protein [Halobaculum sp. CBA1158]UIO99277.1 hypothetical protein Hbl1158_12155 [Halobaculum sp. CBA1158]
MVRLRAEALLGGAEGLLSRPRRIVDHRRLGEPGESITGGDGGAVGRLSRVEEVPLAHVDVDPDVRERLCHLLGNDRTVFVHYVE